MPFKLLIEAAVLRSLAMIIAFVTFYGYILSKHSLSRATSGYCYTRNAHPPIPLPTTPLSKNILCQCFFIISYTFALPAKIVPSSLHNNMFWP